MNSTSRHWPTTKLPFRPVRKQTVTDDVESQLREAILSGAIPPGAPLAEAQLANQMGVNRASVRQAKFRLSQEGLLRIGARGTAFVVTLTAEDVKEIVEFREALDVAAIRLACNRVAREDLDRLEQLIDQTEQASDLLSLTLLDISFHEEVVQVAGNTRLLDAWRLFKPQLLLWLAGMHRLHNSKCATTKTKTVESHRGLLTALESRNVKKCESLARRHAKGLKKELFDAYAAQRTEAKA